MRRTLFTEDHEAFRELARDFIEKEVVPAYPQWEKAGRMPREAFAKLGETGIMGITLPEEYGGGGQDDYRYNMVLQEEAARALVTLSTVRTQLEVILPYFLHYANDEQRQRWFPGLADGSLLTAIAMTEPGTGSDLRGIRTSARRDGDHWILNGQKTFISSGIMADLVVVAACTDPDAGSRGLSLFVVERDTPGFVRGRQLDKIGLPAQDTAELFFDDARIPAANLLGEEGRGLQYLMGHLPRERLGVSAKAMATTRAIYELTVEYCKDRKAFGKPVAEFQNTRYKLAEVATQIKVGRAFIDQCVERLVAGTLDTATASMAKLWATDTQGRVVDECLQLFGGYGYMAEYPISRFWTDARVLRIYGGTSEIMKELVARSLLGR